MTTPEDLAADLNEAVDQYEADLDAYRADPNEATRAAYKTSAAAVDAARAALRAAQGRLPGTGHAIGGDAFISNPEG